MSRGFKKNKEECSLSEIKLTQDIGGKKVCECKAEIRTISFSLILDLCPKFLTVTRNAGPGGMGHTPAATHTLLQPGMGQPQNFLPE